MRTFLIAALVIVLVIVLVVASPLLDGGPSEATALPGTGGDENMVSPMPGDAPSFDVETGSVRAGSESAGAPAPPASEEAVATEPTAP